MIYREVELKVSEAIDGRVRFVLPNVDVTIGTQEQWAEINEIRGLTLGLSTGDRVVVSIRSTA